MSISNPILPHLISIISLLGPHLWPHAQSLGLQFGKTLPGTAYDLPYSTEQKGTEHLGISVAKPFAKRFSFSILGHGYYRHVECNRGICDEERISKALQLSPGVNYRVIDTENRMFQVGLDAGYLKDWRTFKGITFPWKYQDNRNYLSYGVSLRAERKHFLFESTGVYLQLSAQRLYSLYNHHMEYVKRSISPFDIGNFKDFPHDLVYNFSVGVSYSF